MLTGATFGVNLGTDVADVNIERKVIGMFVFALLLSVWTVLQLPIVWRRLGLTRQVDRAAWAFGATFVCTGLLHFLRPEPFVAMMPPMLPCPELLVAVSGAVEILIGAGLMRRTTRRTAALAAAALLIAVVPANVYAAVSGVAIPDYPSAGWYRWLRVFLQIPLIAWVLTVWRRFE